ncbi:Hypothetical_protein [Hexamita inflata]|uniref:Hypothetical_protein n=1 Tax=Hexamita inflata TaxID=28002 RepID=A0AA86QG52_9EUKA|nr:Hypothetical protein HINF_LOCUS45148 [Hexamita inflata]
MIGYSKGCISFYNVQISTIINGNVTISNYGIIGQVNENINVSFQLLQLSYNYIAKQSYANTETNVSALIGQVQKALITINNTQICDTNVISSSNTALLIGYLSNSNVEINFLNVCNSSVLSVSSQLAQSAGFFCVVSNSLLNIQTINIEQINITTINAKQSFVGGIVALSKLSTLRIQKIKILLSNITSTSISTSYTSGLLANIQNSSYSIDSYKIIQSNIISIGNVSFSAGIVSFTTFSKSQVQAVLVEKSVISAQSEQLEGVSAGIIGVIQNSDILVTKITIKITIIQSNSNYVRTGGIIAKFYNGTTQIDQIVIENSQILATDILFRNITLDPIPIFNTSTYWGYQAMIIGYLFNATAVIDQIQLQNSNLQQHSKESNCVGGIIGFLRYTSVKINRILIQNISINASSSLYSCSSAINGAYDIIIKVPLNDFQNSTLSNIQVINCTVMAHSDNFSSWSGGISALVIQNVSLDITNVIVQQTQIIASGSNEQSFSGGIFGQFSESIAKQITNVIIQHSQILSQNNLQVYCGGFIGYSNNSNIQLSGITIKNTNISAKSILSDVFTGSFGYLSQQNLNMYDISLKNILFSSNGVNVYQNSVVGYVYNKNNIIMSYSVIESVQISATGTNLFQSMLMYFQNSDINNNVIQIKKSYSTGFSNINDKDLDNCKQLEINISNLNEYVVEQKGCQ